MVPRSTIAGIAVILVAGWAVAMPARPDARQADARVEALIASLGTRYWDQAVDGLVAIGDPPVGPLIAHLRSGTGGGRPQACLALARIGAPAGVDAVHDALASPDSAIRSGAAEALGFVRSERSVTALIGVVTQETGQVRRAAVAALGALGDPRATGALANALSDRAWYVREEAAWVLSELKAPGAAAPLPAARPAGAGRGVRRTFVELSPKIWLAVGSALILWVLHRWIGAYPPPLGKSSRPGRGLRDATLLWLVALATETLRVVAVTPWLERTVQDPTLRELALVPLLSVPYVALPLAFIRSRRWSARDLGLTWETRSSRVAAFALGFGILGGSIPFLTGQAVMGYEPQPAGVFVLLVYTNAFLEEFFHRGVVQSLLERALGQGPAIVGGAALFGLTHVAFDMSRLAGSEGIPGVALAMLLQGMAGGLFGIIFVKTRSLWPGMACHYLLNWLSAILVAGTR